MDLIEGISNEVVFTFLVTVLLIVLAVFYTFFSEETLTISRTSNVDRSRNNESHDETINSGSVSTIHADETRDDTARSQPDTDVADSSTATREETSNAPQHRQHRNSENDTERTTQDVRRRVVNSPESGVGQSTDGEHDPIVIKVKHNENIQTFTVTKNITVIELKR